MATPNYAYEKRNANWRRKRSKKKRTRASAKRGRRRASRRLIRSSLPRPNPPFPRHPRRACTAGPARVDARQPWNTGDSRRKLPASASSSTSPPTGTMNCSRMWPIIAPR